MPIRPENKDRYPDDWDQISHRIRFERAEGRCEFCRIAYHGQPHPVTGLRLPIFSGSFFLSPLFTLLDF